MCVRRGLVDVQRPVLERNKTISEEAAFMAHSEIYRFSYTRSAGMKRTYDVTVNLVRRDSGVFAYEAWVHAPCGDIQG